MNLIIVDYSIDLNPKTIKHLKLLGIENAGSSYMPVELFSLNVLDSNKGWVFLFFGGFLIGFGTRYAGGCTSGHAISGLSNLQLPSLIAVVGFFFGGLVMAHFFLPFSMPANSPTLLSASGELFEKSSITTSE